MPEFEIKDVKVEPAVDAPKPEEKEIKPESKVKTVLDKLSATEFLAVKAFFDAEKAPEKEAAPMPKPELPKPEMKKDEPKKEEKAPEVKPLDKKPEVKPEEPKADKPMDEAVILGEAMKLLEELKAQESAEGEPEDVKKVEAIIGKIKMVLDKKPKSEKKEDKAPVIKPEEKKPEVKKELPKPEEKKPELPKAEPPKMEEKKPMPKSFKASDLVPLFIKKEPLSDSKWVLIDKASKQVVLRAELGSLFGNELEAKKEFVVKEDFAKAIASAIEAKGMTKEAVMEAAAAYAPCYPTEKKIVAPEVSKHPKAKDKAPVETDKEASAVAPVVKTAEEKCEEPKKEEEKKEEVKEATTTPQVAKTAEKAETDALAAANPEGSQVKESVNHKQQESSHAKSTDNAGGETDKKVAELENKIKALAEEKAALTTKLAETTMAHNLDKKMATCKVVIEDMVSKGLLTPSEEYRQAAMKEGNTVEAAKRIALGKTVEDQLKKLLQMDDSSLSAFASSIAGIEKKASVVKSDVLKDPLHVASSLDSGSDVKRISDILANKWN